MDAALALAGGKATYSGPWPAWPQYGPGVEGLLTSVLDSGRWAVSGDYRGAPPLDIELGRTFAQAVGTRHCLPVDHGSSALIIALAALGVGPGDEVIVPGLTWVASASVVARLGATAILCDVESSTQCLDPDAVEACIGPRTAAIVAVHLYSAMADMDRLCAIASRHGIALVEDCAQAYGAQWGGRSAGSIGAFGAFSTQQGKALTSGEGGLLVCDDADLAATAEMLRGDGRRYHDVPPPIGAPSLAEFSAVQGWNMHLSEIQAALLLDGLTRLEQQNAARRAAAAYLDDELTAVGGLDVVVPHAPNAVRGYYHYAIRLADGEFAGLAASEVCEALTAELGTHVHAPYPPLNAHPLFDPRRMNGAGGIAAWDPSRFDLPVATAESRRTILIHHSVLLAGRDLLALVVEAFAKVRDHADAVRESRGVLT